MTTAFTRSIPDSFASALVSEPTEAAIDVALARMQHAAYERGLARLGISVITLPPIEAHPDCCFVEDCALIIDGVALVTRPGAETRRGETATVSDALAHRASLRRIEQMRAPATLDGGDCMRVGRQIFVGLSGRTNSEGVDCVRETFGPEGFSVVPVVLSGVLHLKCVCSPLGDRRILLADGSISAATFDGIEIVSAPRDETYAANCFFWNDKALVASGFPETRARLELAGVEVIALDTSEIRKADGSLTCLSLVV